MKRRHFYQASDLFLHWKVHYCRLGAKLVEISETCLIALGCVPGSQKYVLEVDFQMGHDPVPASLAQQAAPVLAGSVPTMVEEKGSRLVAASDLMTTD